MTGVPAISVIVPTHNPDAGRLQRTLRGLCAQTLPATEWELVIVDNASAPALELARYTGDLPRHSRLVREPQLGLTCARRRGIACSAGPILVFADDDNVLAPDYLENVLRLLTAHPRMGALGGKSIPEFEQEPEHWTRDFFPLLALRDLGDRPITAAGLRPPGAERNVYPGDAAPLGAGMGLRRDALAGWLTEENAAMLSDRRGAALTSSGDNDIVFSIVRDGWEVGYFPELRLTHLIPAGRVTCAYLGRLNRGIQESWIRVLAKYDANPWRPIPRWTVPFRRLKSWFACRAWSGPAARVRWQGACGKFDGLSSLR